MVIHGIVKERIIFLYKIINRRVVVNRNFFIVSLKKLVSFIWSFREKIHQVVSFKDIIDLIFF